MVKRFRSRKDGEHLAAKVAGKLTRGPATVDEKSVAGDERGCGRGEKNNGSGHVHRFADAMERRDAFHHVGAKYRIG